MVLGGKVRAAVRMVMNRGTGGAYQLFDLDSKSGRPIIEVLREKHPASRVPSEEDFDAHVGAPDCLESMPVYCFKECVAKAAARLSGSAGQPWRDGTSGTVPLVHGFRSSRIG